MPKHLPTTVWGMRVRGGGYVQTADEQHLSFSFPDGDGMMVTVTVTRADARLWIRRIQQCLDATK